MSSTSENVDLRKVRLEAGLSQHDLAKTFDVAQTTISRIERGFGQNPTRSDASIGKIVEMVKTLGPEGLRQKYREAIGEVAPVAPPEKKKPVKVKRGKARAKALTPAITLELRAFCHKHGLSVADVAEELGQTTSFMNMVFTNKIRLSAPAVAALRQKMAAYKPTAPGQFTPAFDHSVAGHPTRRRASSNPKDIIDIMDSVDVLELSVRSANCLQNAHIKTIHQLMHIREADLLRVKNFGFKSLKEVKNALADYGLSLNNVALKPESVKEEPKAPAAPAAPPIKLSEPAAPVDAPPPPAKEPSLKLKLIVLEGHRLDNGDNIAPLLKLDGKTMHVFTHVPGGVFVSYVEAQMQME